jgi:hypothetical protein
MSCLYEVGSCYEYLCRSEYLHLYSSTCPVFPCLLSFPQGGHLLTSLIVNMPVQPVDWKHRTGNAIVCVGYKKSNISQESGIIHICSLVSDCSRNCASVRHHCSTPRHRLSLLRSRAAYLREHQWQLQLGNEMVRALGFGELHVG